MSDEGLAGYVQLQTVKKSQEILLEALAGVLLEMKPMDRVAFCRSLQGQIQERLQSGGEDYSAQAQLLGLMCRQLFEIVQAFPAPPSDGQ